MKRVEPASSLVLVVDIQEKLARAMPEQGFSELKRAARILLESAAALSANLTGLEACST